MNYTHIIWDFNGTLLDDVDLCISCANHLTSAHNLPILASKEQYQSVFMFPITEYYRNLGFDFERVPYDVLAHEWIADYNKHRHSAPLFSDVFPALEYFKGKAIPQLILSATEQGMLREQVNELGISSYFTELLGRGDIYAGSKEDIGLSWRKNHPTALPLLIGDTNHDYLVAKAMGIDCALVYNGHQNKETLAKCHPKYLCKDLKELITQLQQ